MNPISRGVRNAFRNSVRTVSIAVILGLSIGLCLTMLIAKKAVDTKIISVKSSIGNTISVTPAGFRGFSGGGTALTQSAISKLTSLNHVSAVSEGVTEQLRDTDTTGRDGSTESANTSLSSAVDPGSLGQRFGGQSPSGSSDTAPTPPAGLGDGSFSIPVNAYGQSDTTELNGTHITIKSGSTISGATDKDVALVGSTLATKNNLSVGSTFTANGEVITVAGIFDSGTTFSNNSVIFSLPTLQRLSSQTDQITEATITVDSISNIDSVTNKVKSTLGSSADVTSSKSTAESAIEPLNSVKTIAAFSLVGAIVAGAIIILLTMVMVVRERKREIGVAKAIGGSNIRIIGEFMIESLTLALLGAAVGLVIGVVGAQPVTKMLVTNSQTSNRSSSQFTPGSGQRPLGMGGPGRGFANNAAVRGLTNIKAQVGFATLLEGFGAAVLISAIGSALASSMISRIRPSNVMRAE